jgi:hypothetical protein
MNGYCINADKFKALILEVGKIKEHYEQKNEIFKILWDAKKIGDE